MPCESAPSLDHFLRRGVCRKLTPARPLYQTFCDPIDVPSSHRSPRPTFFSRRHRMARGRPIRQIHPRTDPSRVVEIARDALLDHHQRRRQLERGQPTPSSGTPAAAAARAARCGFHQLSRDVGGTDGDGWDADAGVAGAWTLARSRRPLSVVHPGGISATALSP